MTIVTSPRGVRPLVLFLSILLGSMTVVGTAIVQAQDCDFTVDKTDEFTGARTQMLERQTLHTQHNQQKTEALLVTFALQDDGKDAPTPMMLLTYERAFSRPEPFCIQPGDSLLIKFADGSRYALATVSQACADLSYVGNGRHNYALGMTFLLTPSDVQRLQAQPIDLLRLSFSAFQTTIALEPKLKRGSLGFGRKGNSRANPQTWIQQHVGCVVQ